MDEFLLGLLFAVAANGLFDAIVVAYLAGKRSKKALVTYLEDDSDEGSGPLWDKLAAKVDARTAPQIRALHGEISQEIGHLEARMSAELPHPDTAIADMKAELETTLSEVHTKIDGIDAGMGKAFELLDSKLMSAFGQMGKAETELRGKLAEAAEDMEGAMQGAIQELDPNNPIAQRMYAMLTRPVDPKWESKYPGQAFLLQAGKTWIAQNVLPGLMAGGETQRAARAFLGSNGGVGEAIH